MDPKHDNASDEKVNPEHLENRDDDSLVFLDAAEEEAMRKRVLRKLDVRVLPVLWLLFLFSFLDRTSIGNASILGLKADLNLSSLAYSQALALYFLFYILAEVPATLVLKKAGPKVWLPVMTAAWGIVTITIGFVQSAEGLFAVRCILGMAEGGLLPCMVLYLSTLCTSSISRLQPLTQPQTSVTRWGSDSLLPTCRTRFPARSEDSSLLDSTR